MERELRPFCTLCQNFNSMALVSREEQAQTSVLVSAYPTQKLRDWFIQTLYYAKRASADTHTNALIVIRNIILKMFMNKLLRTLWKSDRESNFIASWRGHVRGHTTAVACGERISSRRKVKSWHTRLGADQSVVGNGARAVPRAWPTT